MSGIASGGKPLQAAERGLQNGRGSRGAFPTGSSQQHMHLGRKGFVV